MIIQNESSQLKEVTKRSCPLLTRAFFCVEKGFPLRARPKGISSRISIVSLI